MRDVKDGTWTEIGKRCSANRRSLWVRLTADEQAWSVVELCAGREGDDSYVRIAHDNPLFHEILNVVTTAKFAAET